MNALNWVHFLAAWICAAQVPALGQSNATSPDANASAALPEFDPAWTNALPWRPLGPAAVGGRIVDLAVSERDPVTFYIATASGGAFKTINGGTTFAPVFERQPVASIGDVAVSPSHPDIVWVGTGEHNARNSVSWGDGVYKSTDGGKSWLNMGLRQSFQIGRIAIHPTNPNIVYVGALGRLWGPNEERGLYKTADGGKTWNKVLHVDERTGCVEVQMNPADPETLLVAMYERERDIYCAGDPAKRWGPGSGLYKTTNGGGKWTRQTRGLPTRPMGRIGISYYRKNPKVVFAIIETDKIGEGPAIAFAGVSGTNGAKEARIGQVVVGGPAAKAGVHAGDVVTRLGEKAIETYEEFSNAIRDHKVGEKVKLVVQRDGMAKDLELVLGVRESGSKPFGAQLGGQNANADKQQGQEGFETGGVFKSDDGGDTWQRVNSLNPRPFYYSQIHVDPSDDRYVYVLGIQFHHSADGGKSFQTTSASRVHADHHAMWIDPHDGRHMRLGCDGGFYTSHDRGLTWDFHDVLDIAQFYDVGVDTRRPYWVYGGLQDNGSWGAPSRKRGATGPENADWLRIGGGDGFVCRVDPEDSNTVYVEMQYGRMSRINVATGERTNLQPPGQGLRFNWKTPMLISPHNSRLFYCAANYVFGSVSRGTNLQRLSPDITRTDKGSATALAESPREAGVLWVGTDDGALWISRDAGRNWKSAHEKTGLPPFHVASIEVSRFRAGRAYVAFDGHRSNNDEPHILVTEDYGQSWRSLRANLPVGSTRVLREDVTNENLLYCGTEFGIWASTNRGRSWARIHHNLPTVAVHEIAVHTTAGEIIAATHGRGIWVLDVTLLRQLASPTANETRLYAPETAVLWAGGLSRSHFGNRHFAGQNPTFGVTLMYRLNAEAKAVSLDIRTSRGEILRQFTTQKKAGLHSVLWDLRAGDRSRLARVLPAAVLPAAGTPVKPGVYLVRLVVDGHEHLRELAVQSDPEFPQAMLQEELEESVRKLRQPVIE